MLIHISFSNNMNTWTNWKQKRFQSIPLKDAQPKKNNNPGGDAHRENEELDYFSWTDKIILDDSNTKPGNQHPSSEPRTLYLSTNSTENSNPNQWENHLIQFE